MKKILLTLLAVFTLSCNDDDNSGNTNEVFPQDIEFNTVAKGIALANNVYINTSPTNLTIKNNTDWNVFYTNMMGKSTPEFIETNIDFNNFMVIAMFDKGRPSGGYEVSISSIIENTDNIVVDVEYIGDGDDTTMPTCPYHIVRIPKSNKNVVFLP
jgi:hypothetical protein